MRKTVAIMQPYFAPYGGYWRLLAAADVFVIYDCVQFPRRGWVHRNRLPDAKGEPQWLTLPLAHAPFDAAISSLAFRPDAPQEMAARVRAFPSLVRTRPAGHALLHAAPFQGAAVDYLEAHIAAGRDALRLDCALVRSSTLDIDPALRAQERVLAILRAVGGSDYVNAPGGAELYEAEAFARQGACLRFLPPYPGPSWSLLHRLAQEPPEAVRAEVLAAL